MTAFDNVRTVRRFLEAGPSGDDPERSMFRSPQLIWHVPGNGLVADRYQGCTGVFEVTSAETEPVGGWDVRVVEVMGNEDLVVATVYLIGHRGPVRVDNAAAQVFRFDIHGVITEAWGFVADQDALGDVLLT